MTGPVTCGSGTHEMTIPNGRESGICTRSRSFYSLFSSRTWFSERAPRVNRSTRIALAIAAMSLAATCAFAAPTRLLTARFAGDCGSFTIAVTGEGLDEPNPIVSYNITLTPRSGGEPISIVDSFEVTPEKNGSFRKTISASWKKFEFTLADNYNLSGSVLLTSNLNLLHNLTIRFARKKLNCG